MSWVGKNLAREAVFCELGSVHSGCSGDGPHAGYDACLVGVTRVWPGAEDKATWTEAHLSQSWLLSPFQACFSLPSHLSLMMHHD